MFFVLSECLRQHVVYSHNAVKVLYESNSFSTNLLTVATTLCV